MERLASKSAFSWLVLSLSFLNHANALRMTKDSDTVTSQNYSIFYTAPPHTFIEKQHFRSNGQILITFNTNPDVYQVDPTRNQTAALVYHFEGTTSTLGIAETHEDVFQVITGNYTSAPVFGGQQGSFSVWQLDLRGFQPNGANPDNGARASKIVDVPDAINLDGLVTVNTHAGLLITGDTATGTLYRVNVRDRQVWRLLVDPLLNRTSESTSGIDSIGVDGLAVSSNNLYFSNLAKQSIGRIPLDTQSATLTGPPSIIYTASSFIDGFTVDPLGNIFFTKPFDGVFFLRNGTEQLVVESFGANGCMLESPADFQATLYFTFDDTINNSSGIAEVDIEDIFK